MMMQITLTQPFFSFLFLISAFFTLPAQGLVVEWQSPPGTQPPGFLLDINGFQDGQLDYDGNGLNELVTIQTPPGGQPTLVIISDNQTVLLGGITEIAGHPITDYKFRGFDNVGGNMEKELIFAPKPGTGAPIVIGRLQGDMGMGITTIGSAHPDTLLFLVNIQNMDADITCELISYEFPSGILQVWGEGFTPELGPPVPEEGSEKSTQCEDFMIEWISPPNMSWPSANQGYLPAGARDFNGDGVEDLSYWNDSLLYIINPLNQEVLWSGVIPGDIWIGEEFGPYLLGFFDFCGSGHKQILLGASDQLLSFPILLHEVDQWAVVDSTGPVLNDTLYWTRIGDVFSGLPGGSAPLTLRSVSDPDQDGKMELFFQHEINRRILLVGSEADGFQEGPPAGLTPADPAPNSGPYDLALKFESAPASRPIFDLGNLLSRQGLDLNGDHQPELIVWREGEGDTTATGCRVFDLQNQQLLWSFDFPAGQLGDTLRRFHGFYDANGDGERELFLGARTVVTQDGQTHQPFGAFRTFAMIDMDGDGYEDVLGITPQGRIQIWGKMQSTSTGQPGYGHLIFTVFPNPAASTVHLSLEARHAGTYTARLLDLQGREQWIWSWNLPSGAQLLLLEGMESLPAGLYLVHLAGPDAQEVRPLVITR